MSILLKLSNLTVNIPNRWGVQVAVSDISLNINAGEIHGLVGESGAGKSTIGAAIMGLLEHPAYIKSGTIHLADLNLSQLNEEDYHAIRGKKISMIFQDPQTSLNPLLTISDQLVETILQHEKMTYKEARKLALHYLKDTGIENAEQRMDDYPHQFSGGMRQRVVIALALCTKPSLIIADEPTTALDVSIQKHILQLIKNLVIKHKMGLLLITHDIGVIAEVTNKVTVLRNGKLVESGPTLEVLQTPKAKYTRSLISAVPRIDKRTDQFIKITEESTSQQQAPVWRVSGASSKLASEWLLQAHSLHTKGSTAYKNSSLLTIDKLSVAYPQKRPWFRKQPLSLALKNVSLTLKRGEVFGVVGESGSGKSTLAKAVVGLLPYASGTIHYQSELLPSAEHRSRQHSSRRQIQMVFQDPYSSLNNRRSVEAILTEPLKFYRLTNKSQDARRLAASVLELVELPQQALRKFPHQFSGGQRQRIAIARALMARPEFLICDEPTSALDVSIQAQILNLLKELQQSLGLTVLFISHDLAVIRQMCDHVMVLKHGNQIETRQTEDLFTSPATDYSRQLLSETPALSNVTVSI